MSQYTHCEWFINYVIFPHSEFIKFLRSIVPESIILWGLAMKVTDDLDEKGMNIQRRKLYQRREFAETAGRNIIEIQRSQLMHVSA